MRYLNIHTHLASGFPNLVEIESRYFGQEGPTTAQVRSAGLHPWYLDGVDLGVAEQWLRRQADDPAVLAIGEAGLDKITGAPVEVQSSAFQCCIRVAVAFRKPLIIHCVRAFDEVLALLPPANTLPAVFHGFDKHPQTAAMVLRAGYFLSFGAALLRTGSAAAAALRQTPPNRLFLETDDKPVAIQAVYAQAAALLGMDEAALIAQIWTNFNTMTGQDQT